MTSFPSDPSSKVSGKMAITVMNECQDIKHVLILKDEHSKRTIVLKSATYSIGREPQRSNSIVIDSPVISRHHATLLRLTIPGTPNYHFRLIDGNLQGKRSRNGITVNGDHCFSHNLQHGDEICFGGVVKAKYYATANEADLNFLNHQDSEDISDFLSKLDDPFTTLISSDSNPKNETNIALERLASFPELLSSPIIEIDLNGTITYLNPAALEWFPDIQETKLQHPILASMVSSVQNGKETHFVRELKIGNRFFELSIYYITTSETIRCYIVDITDRKLAEELIQKANDRLETRVKERTAELASINESLKAEISERKRAEDALKSSIATNRALLNAIPDLMFRISSEGYLVNYKGTKEKEHLKLEKNLKLDGSFLGKHVSEAFPTEIVSLTLKSLEQALATGEVQIFEWQLSVDNESHNYEVRMIVTEENEVMALIRDITERKRAEEDIHKALEKEKHLNELKSRFVSMTSHEFRTPLTTILSSAQLIERYAHKWDEQKKLNYLQTIQKAAQDMTGLLNDVLLVGKAEAGRLAFNPASLELSQFCQKLVEEIQINSSSHQIIFRSQSQCQTICLDQKIIRHILTNLLSNAIKYSPDSDEVYFDLICDSEKAIFRVEDRGMGIPITEQDRLFNSFYRASNVGSVSGTGLGLTIVKRCVDLHRGEIRLESQVDVGTTFIVTLPNYIPEISSASNSLGVNDELKRV